MMLLPFPAFSQTAIVKGKITDASQVPVSGAEVKIADTQLSAISDTTGAFEIKDVPYGNYSLIIKAVNFVNISVRAKVNEPEVVIAPVVMTPDDFISAGDDIPASAIVESDLRESSSSSNVSSVLGGSRDVFTNATTFTFGISRFRLRGYDNGYAPTIMNGAIMTDLTTGRDMFYTWSGLNDVVRMRENTLGLDPSYHTFGGIAGSSYIDSRAARQRKQIQASYALSNRTYDNRLMFTYGSGVLKGGWSFAASVSRRWANEGYVKGTFYDSWAYFGSVEKQLNENHSLSFTGFGSPLRNGRQAPAVQEMYDIAGTNYYNPVWGYQNGEVRNANVGRSHTPAFILSHEWQIDNTSSLETSVSRIAGKTKISGLDWFNATDPRADFYRRLPSFIANVNPEEAMVVYSLLSNSEEERQIKWDDLYESNYLSDSTLYNADGIAGNTVQGRWASYLVQDRVTDMRKTGFNTVYNKTLNETTNFTAGFSHHRQRTEYYKEVNDLLGADFYVDLNQYAEESNIDSAASVQNNLNNPNNVLYKGDRYGYDYIADISKTTGWAQAVLRHRFFDYFFGAELSNVNYYREGKFRNGVFADDSYGRSAVQKFVDVSAKAGITYKYNGRNYFFVNGSYFTQAPDFEDAYFSPRTRNTTASDLKSESASTLEGGYLLKAPKLKGRAVFYTTEFKDQINTTSFYHEDFRTFVNYTVSNIDRRHTGVELALEANIGYGFSATGVASMGRYIFTSNPSSSVTQDNLDTLLADNETVYLRNFHVGGTPEKAYTVGVNYRSSKFWFVYLNVNYFDDIYIAANPARRTGEAIDLVPSGSDQYHAIVDQEKVDGQFTVDLSGGKSWKLNNRFKSLKKNTFLLLNVGITNLLNNRDFINGGFEQLRFDYFNKDQDKFAPKYFYSYGTTFFVSLTLRLN